MFEDDEDLDLFGEESEEDTHAEGTDDQDNLIGFDQGWGSDDEKESVNDEWGTSGTESAFSADEWVDEEDESFSAAQEDDKDHLGSGTWEDKWDSEEGDHEDLEDQEDVDSEAENVEFDMGDDSTGWVDGEQGYTEGTDDWDSEDKEELHEGMYEEESEGWEDDESDDEDQVEDDVDEDFVFEYEGTVDEFNSEEDFEDGTQEDEPNYEGTGESNHSGLEDVIESLEDLENEEDEEEDATSFLDLSNFSAEESVEDKEQEENSWGTDNEDDSENEEWGTDYTQFTQEWGTDESSEDVVESEDEEEEEFDWSAMYAGMSTEPSEIEVEEPVVFEDEYGYEGNEETLEVEDIETLRSNLLSSNFQVEKSAYSLTHDTILIDDIVISGPVTKARAKTHAGLTASVGEMGVLTPIDVLIMEGYQDWLNTPEDERSVVYTGNKYQLLSGMRRIFAAKKNGLDEIPAQIWAFHNPEYGREVAILLSCILDKKQRHSWGEIWNTMGVLEDQFAELTPTQLEYLLEIEPGDSMKLKDVMGSQNEYPEIVHQLLDGEKNLQQCYQALQKARKELSQWDREDSIGVSGVEEAGDLVEGIGGEGLSNSDVMGILNMANEDINLSEDDFGGDIQEGVTPVEQDVDDRHPLDPVLRGNVLVRDGYSCQCCRFGEDLNNSLVLPSLTVHHMIPVYINKMKHPTVRCQDVPENLVTLCDACHKAVHSCSDSRAKLPVHNEQEFFEMEPFQQERWKNILKYARIITKAETVTGFQRKKHDSKTLPVSKPFWEAGAENEEAIALAQNASL